MEFSQYNTLFIHKGKKLIYNSLTNAFGILNDAQYEAIRKGIHEKEINSELPDELISQLKKAKIIVESDEDEILKLKHETNQIRYYDKRLELTIIPTLDCNFACPYCFESHYPESISQETIEAIIAYIKRFKTVNEIFVSWMGGEPLLEFEKIKLLANKIRGLGLHYDSQIVTNGYLLDEEKIESLKSIQVSSVQITLDGMPDTHNSKRFLKKGKKPTFDAIIENISLLISKNPNINISIRVNLDKNNVNEFKELVYLLKERINLSKCFLYPAFIDDITGKENICMIDRKQQVDILTDLFYKDGFRGFPFYPNNYIQECAVRNVNATIIGPAGEIYTCWNNIGNKNHVIGNIKDDLGFNPLWLKYKIGADPFDDEKCMSCKIFPICRGGCPDVRIRNKYFNAQIDPCSKYKGKGLVKLLKAHYDVKNNI